MHSKSHLFDEEPITSKEQDLLQHYSIVNEIAGLIKGSAGNNGRVIALYGRNGSGKTSIVNLLKKELNDEKSIHFQTLEPYSYKSEKEITKAFFDAIKNLLSVNSILPQINTIPEKYYSLFYGLSLYKVSIQNFIQFFSTNNTPADLREIIEWYLMNMNFKVILIIDNIDRCSIKNRHLLFQFINTVGRIKNLFFIIAASHSELLSNKEPTVITMLE